MDDLTRDGMRQMVLFMYEHLQEFQLLVDGRRVHFFDRIEKRRE